MQIRLAGQFNDHKSTVWRLKWNAMGTVVASTGDDGNVKMWKANYQDRWQCTATIKEKNPNFPRTMHQQLWT